MNANGNGSRVRAHAPPTSRHSRAKALRFGPRADDAPLYLKGVLRPLAGVLVADGVGWRHTGPRAWPGCPPFKSNPYSDTSEQAYMANSSPLKPEETGACVFFPAS
eukprot:scaffold54510_cov69-Phaeocystis_antarctica.AAC.5